MPTNKQDKNKHYLGHRKRIKEDFLNRIQEEQITDAMLLEIMLFAIYSRKDVKPIVKEILHHFGNIRKFSIASIEEIENKICKNNKYIEQGKNTVKNLYFIAKLINNLTLKTIRGKITESNKITFHTHDDVITYLRHKFGNLKQEHFNIIFLSANNTILDISVISIGTINEVVIYDREIIKKAIDVGAVSIILAHNHFSGDPEPSKADKDITLKIAEACERFQIVVLDHIIVTNDSYYSFKENGVQINLFKY